MEAQALRDVEEKHLALFSKYIHILKISCKVGSFYIACNRFANKRSY